MNIKMKIRPENARRDKICIEENAFRIHESNTKHNRTKEIQKTWMNIAFQEK